MKKTFKEFTRQNLAKGGVVKHMKKPVMKNGRVMLDAGGLLGNITNPLGLTSQFNATAAPIANPTNAADIANAQSNVNTALTGQQSLATQTQPGVTQGLQTQNNLTGELQGVINGTGPNPAQTQLNQNTATNVANTGALIASQRGASSNPALAARSAALAGAQTQQTAAGQAATLQAQQQIAAQQQQAALAQQQVSQGQNATSANTTAQGNEQATLLGAQGGYNSTVAGAQSAANTTNATTAAQNTKANASMLGSLESGLGSVAGALGLAKGGEVTVKHVHYFDDGGDVSASDAYDSIVNAHDADTAAAPVVKPQAGPLSSGLKAAATAYNPQAASAAPSTDSAPQTPIAGAFKGFSSGYNPQAHYRGGKIATGPYKSHVANFMASGGQTQKVPAMVSAGETYLNPKQVQQVIGGADPRHVGTHIEGKATVKGDSLKNDTIPMDLDAGGVVIDRETMATHDSKKMRKFVIKSVAKHMKKGSK